MCGMSMFVYMTYSTFDRISYLNVFIKINLFGEVSLYSKIKQSNLISQGNPRTFKQFNQH